MQAEMIDLNLNLGQTTLSDGVKCTRHITSDGLMEFLAPQIPPTYQKGQEGGQRVEFMVWLKHIIYKMQIIHISGTLGSSVDSLSSFLKSRLGFLLRQTQQSLALSMSENNRKESARIAENKDDSSLLIIIMLTLL